MSVNGCWPQFSKRKTQELLFPVGPYTEHWAENQAYNLPSMPGDPGRLESYTGVNKRAKPAGANRQPRTRRQEPDLSIHVVTGIFWPSSFCSRGRRRHVPCTPQLRFANGRAGRRSRTGTPGSDPARIRKIRFFTLLYPAFWCRHTAPRKRSGNWKPPLTTNPENRFGRSSPVVWKN